MTCAVVPEAAFLFLEQLNKGSSKRIIEIRIGKKV
jgi:hypothetical protein